MTIVYLLWNRWMVKGIMIILHDHCIFTMQWMDGKGIMIIFHDHCIFTMQWVDGKRNHDYFP